MATISPSSSRPMSAAWSGPAGSPSGSARRSPSSTSGASGQGVSEVMNIIGDVRGTLHPGGRHRRFRRHALQRRGGAAGGRRLRGLRLCDPWRAVGRRGARVSSSKLKQLVITDSIQATEAVRVSRNIRELTIAPLIGEAMRRTSARTLGVEPVRLKDCRAGSRRWNPVRHPWRPRARLGDVSVTEPINRVYASS